MDRNIQLRIQKVVDTLCNGNKSAFCRRINRPAQAIKDIIGGKKSAPGYELICDIISSDLGISPSRLLLGTGSMLSHPRDEESPQDPPQIPLVPETLDGVEEITKDPGQAAGLYKVAEFSNSDFLIRIKGNSMAPKYIGGDILACKKVPDSYFQWGRVYVIWSRSQGIMVKRVLPSESESQIKCVSDNAKYPPFDMPKEDILTVALVNGAITLE